MITITPLEVGIPYRINELAELIGKTRPTVERYIERFSIECVQVEHCGKTVSAVVLTDENIKQLMTVLKAGIGNPSKVDHNLFQPINESPSEGDRILSQPDHDLFQPDHKPLISSLESRLAETTAKMEGFKALLEERERLIESKESEISTLKTTLMILERNKQDKPVELIPSNKPKGVIGKLIKATLSKIGL